MGRQGEVSARIDGEWGREAARHMKRARSATVPSEQNKRAEKDRAADGGRRLFESIPAVMERVPGGQARGGRRFVPSSQAARAEPLRVATAEIGGGARVRMPALSRRHDQSRAWESSDDRAGAQGPPRGGGWRGPHKKVQGAAEATHGGGGTFAVGGAGMRGGSSELMRLLAMRRSSPSTAPPLASSYCRPSAKSVIESTLAPLLSTLWQGSSSSTTSD